MTALTGLSPLRQRSVAQPPPAPSLPERTAPAAADRFDRFSIGLGGAALFMVGMATLAPSPAQAQVVVQPAGTLYVSDFFDTKTEPTPHGELVERSAKELGFQGDVVRHEVPENPITRQSRRLDAYLNQRAFSPEEMREYLGKYTEQCQVGQMQTATQDLKMWLEQGAHHSAINLSRGCGQSQVVDALYDRISPAWNSHDSTEQIAAQRRLTKIASGLEVDVDDLLSRDPVVAGPARQQLGQRLVDLVARASQESSLLTQAQAEYDEVVSALAEQKVSVVVAAANSGTILDDMASDAHGLRVSVPENFWNNRLANSEVVTVGATRSVDGKTRVAEYSNPDSGIDLFADGDIKVNYGTSFAAPRVGAVLSTVHANHPEWSNEQVHGYVLDNLSAPLDAQVPQLDATKAQQYLVAK